jgi:hypothetical protein
MPQFAAGFISSLPLPCRATKALAPRPRSQRPSQERIEHRFSRCKWSEADRRGQGWAQEGEEELRSAPSGVRVRKPQFWRLAELARRWGESSRTTMLPACLSPASRPGMALPYIGAAARRLSITMVHADAESTLRRDDHGTADSAQRPCGARRAKLRLTPANSGGFTVNPPE